LPKKIEVHDKRRRPPIMADQIRHKDVDYIGIDAETLHSTYDYTDYWHAVRTRRPHNEPFPQRTLR
jgi:hypothetical protein